jgi:hypothetical protein
MNWFDIGHQRFKTYHKLSHNPADDSYEFDLLWVIWNNGTYEEKKAYKGETHNKLFLIDDGEGFYKERTDWLAKGRVDNDFISITINHYISRKDIIKNKCINILNKKLGQHKTVIEKD